VRNVDLVVLALAIPVWIAVGLPALGWVATTVSWLLARWFQAFAERRAAAKGNRQAALGARAASLLGRLYLVTMAVFVAGLIDREAGLTAALLAVVVFTAYFISLFLRAAFEEDAA
jgi:small-conductance mechanosensitive channel